MSDLSNAVRQGPVSLFAPGTASSAHGSAHPAVILTLRPRPQSLQAGVAIDGHDAAIFRKHNMNACMSRQVNAVTLGPLDFLPADYANPASRVKTSLPYTRVAVTASSPIRRCCIRLAACFVTATMTSEPTRSWVCMGMSGWSLLPVTRSVPPTWESIRQSGCRGGELATDNYRRKPCCSMVLRLFFPGHKPPLRLTCRTYDPA